MNGTPTKIDFALDRWPIVTCAGELEVFGSIEVNLGRSLLLEPCEWRRSRRAPQNVRIGANFAPFSPVALPDATSWDLIKQPLFHVYWTECTDVETYKTSLREEIETWLKELTSRDIHDFLIVVVETYDGKRTNKLLPRTTVLDKVRTDFAAKQGDRCISVINPTKSESRSADSWRGLVARIRHLLLVAYAKAVTRLEDYVRQQRERRNEIGWNFMQYFQLQEELAIVLEMLGLHEEALVQYDELDALFSQFVVNGNTGESFTWLGDFQKTLEMWHGIQIDGCKVLSRCPSLLELRAYLFTKQAQMLLAGGKVWAMAARCLPFLHTTTRELCVLEIGATAGATSCWLFLAVMEVLQICEKHNNADAVEDYSLHTASLWEYASQKLRSLGELCGLTPGNIPSSDQLHIVVGLSAGMGDNPGTVEVPSPTDKLKGALCSQEMFNKTYLELAELAMCTYKHIGRLRSARLVGREAASFYLLLGETQTAASFLGEAVRTFEQDHWHELAAQTRIELADCHRAAADWRKFVKTAARVAAAPEIDTLLRWSYFDEMRKHLGRLERALCVPFDGCVRIRSVQVQGDGVVMQDGVVHVELRIESNFPREIVCDRVAISIEARRGEEQCVRGQLLTGADLRVGDTFLQRLTIKRYLDFKQDKQLASASVACQAPESKRKDSSKDESRSQATMSGEFEDCFLVRKVPLVITPGLNRIKLETDAKQIGKFYLGQIAICMNNFHLISQILTPRLAYEVKEETPTVRLHKTDAPLLSGIEQIMYLIVTIGSYSIEPKSSVKLTASRGLTFQIAPSVPLIHQLELEIGERVPFTSQKTKLRVMADLLTKDHQVSINCSWQTKPICVKLSFQPPLTTTWRLHTAQHRKFIQINVTGQCEKLITVENPQITVAESDCCKIIDLNSKSSQIMPHTLSLSFMWELITNSRDVIKAEFLLNYRFENEIDNKLYKYYFDITDYQTIYVLEANVEPAKGSEFCRDGILCHLHLKIKIVDSSLEQIRPMKSVMYEVLAEQSVWAVCGRTAGVISFEAGMEPQTVVLDIMPLTSGHLPLPMVRISKYIPVELSDKSGHPRLEPFSAGQVYNASKSKQVHVIAPIGDGQ